MNENPPTITRFEVIDHRKETRAIQFTLGRNVIVLPQDRVRIQYFLQDGGQTLKVFLSDL